ncbi:FAD/NAD(P)-binding protein [Brevundimonas sp. Root1279]|uniref:FAD/NAD(P)-binding protein n=1 Tax=Brevundimonas sp. Root1279 TaxID=1736443 RepID=UPI0006F6AB59|nr:FAD/NAD(P)-binding protein [Brevundimonas sp. Root1279]KQW86650.1 FAD-dependent oxidoreductase [Brevundimonas sp. Root1279]
MADGSLRIAIIGGGFSGAMLAARLAEAGVGSALIDRTGSFGPGLAYSTPFEGHLLNVRANRMSAVEGRPDDFTDWLRDHAGWRADPEGFAPRRFYGEYLQHRLNTVRLAHPGLIELVTGEVRAIEADGVQLADGRRIEAAAVVLATGNPAPATAEGRSGRLIHDPWGPGALDKIGPEDAVVIVGSGLTMIDMALWLEANGRRGPIRVLSRRGLTPRAHGAHHDAPTPPTATLLEGAPSERLAEARRLSAESGWRSVMEGLRPVTARLWSEADAPTRARWLRHLRPWWDVHRHRVAPEVQAAIDRLTAEGRLTVSAGRVERIAADADGVSVRWRPRDGSGQPPITGDWLIDCTGPGHDPAKDPLTGPLIKSGRARLDPLRIGLDVAADGRLIGADGTPDDRLFVLGPPARAAFWETTAVPDIRKRIEGLAGVLAKASDAV